MLFAWLFAFLRRFEVHSEEVTVLSMAVPGHHSWGVGSPSSVVTWGQAGGAQAVSCRVVTTSL